MASFKNLGQRLRRRRVERRVMIIMDWRWRIVRVIFLFRCFFRFMVLPGGGDIKSYLKFGVLCFGWDGKGFRCFGLWF